MYSICLDLLKHTQKLAPFSAACPRSLIVDHFITMTPWSTSCWSQLQKWSWHHDDVTIIFAVWPYSTYNFNFDGICKSCDVWPNCSAMTTSQRSCRFILERSRNGRKREGIHTVPLVLYCACKLCSTYSKCALWLLQASCYTAFPLVVDVNTNHLDMASRLCCTVRVWGNEHAYRYRNETYSHCFCDTKTHTHTRAHTHTHILTKQVTFGVNFTQTRS